MTIKARKLTIPENLVGSGSRGGGQGGEYAKLEVPEDYVAICTAVDEYQKNNKPAGWKIDYEVEGLKFTWFLSWSEKARWKIVQTFEAHGFDLSGGVAELDPNLLVGGEVGTRIDLDDDEKYREMKYVFSLEGIEVEEVDPEDIAPPAGTIMDDDEELPEIL